MKLDLLVPHSLPRLGFFFSTDLSGWNHHLSLCTITSNKGEALLQYSVRLRGLSWFPSVRIQNVVLASII